MDTTVKVRSRWTAILLKHAGKKNLLLNWGYMLLFQFLDEREI